jgi:hypothetical protein
MPDDFIPGDKHIEHQRIEGTRGPDPLAAEHRSDTSSDPKLGHDDNDKDAEPAGDQS